MLTYHMMQKLTCSKYFPGTPTELYIRSKVPT